MEPSCASPDSDDIGDVFDAEVFLGEEFLVWICHSETSSTDFEIHQVDWRCAHR